MDPLAVVKHIRNRVGHMHGKDVAFARDNLAVNSLLDRRWPRPAEAMPWNFAVVGRGRNARWSGELAREVGGRRGCSRLRGSAAPSYGLTPPVSSYTVRGTFQRIRTGV